MRQATQVLDSASARTGEAQTLAGGWYTAVCTAIGSGETITIQVSPDGGTTWAATSSTFTVVGALAFLSAADLLYRFVSSGGSSPGADVYLAHTRDNGPDAEELTAA